MSKRIIVDVGDRFGRLVITQELPKIKWIRYFKCKCDCGIFLNVRLQKLRTGHTKSCGCLRIETTKTNFTTHGDYNTRLFDTWSSMKGRCFNKNGRGYKYYGIRGITICPEWMRFSEFKKWAITNGYADNLTIERVNNNGNYEPSNCTWILQKDQTKNTRRNIFITHNGQRLCFAEMIKRVGITRSTLYRRLKTMSMEEALNIPDKKYNYDS